VPDPACDQVPGLTSRHLRESGAGPRARDLWLSARSRVPVTLQAGTEVASTQTEVERSLVFTTDADLHIVPPRLSAGDDKCCSRGGEGEAVPGTEPEPRGSRFRRIPGVLAGPTGAVDAVYFRLYQRSQPAIIHVDLECDPAYGRGVDPRSALRLGSLLRKPGGAVARCEVLEDTTKGMNAAGHIELHLGNLGKAEITARRCIGCGVSVQRDPPGRTPRGVRPVRRIAPSCAASR